ncbi:sulfite exporter TauE/SafE family protein [Labilibaculum sp. DW002]|uniref:Sulfite exporter TauE/SafE family protein n=1 Tax=Paralabilibaculum antarcticum TaxID=2912572 RepID=A0ABT5VS48_9BACT|nr:MULTISPECIES: sulfite exporter TauE/SafE family protein [unclassified Labilibaculum]MBI9056343.1 sulfite exporter TauE/SafE family protein [Labilibaculum sp.]MDE5418223.1 sulfite exporter TauE/SafE family protein [Labilibaculum sp. DW002]
MVYLSALTLGLIGSFHCVGMCGPIALAIPLKTSSWLARITGGLIYNIGRAITYALMGIVFGLLGRGLVMSGFQQWVSVIMGAIMILSVVTPSLYKNRFNAEKGIFSFVGKVKLSLGKLFTQRSYGSLFLIGLLNGLLPCGLVYVAIAAAIATGSSVGGGLFMFIFGLGTLPMMLAISLIGNLITLELRKKITRLIPYAIVFIGILFVLRGLSLGIPFLSPPEKAMTVPTEQVDVTKPKPDCCH